jgi:LacI family transcriptional regulator, galactose operon repressor
MPERPRVALLIETSNSYARGLLRGIHRYLREHRPWTIDMPEQGRGAIPPAHVARWRGDGIIARVENPAIAAVVRQAGLPTIDLSAGRLLPELPMVETNNEAIVRAAFEHLQGAGFKHFAFCGDDRFAWSRLRRNWFERMAAQAGCQASSYPAVRKSSKAGGALSWEQERASLVQWLEGLPKPVGIMACYDQRGWQVLEVCRGIGLGVPDEVAVIGVDNDELLCELAQPSLSSVIPDADRTGYVAAELLGEMMGGRRVEAKEYLIEPLGIAARQSTDALAGADPEIARAIRFIRDHACDSIKVQAVVDEMAVSRRVLEHRFRRLLGRTPHEEILRVQIERVTRLLAETDLPLTTIAERTGFKHAEYMSVAFKRQTGLSPRQFRQQSTKAAQ